MIDPNRESPFRCEPTLFLQIPDRREERSPHRMNVPVGPRPAEWCNFRAIPRAAVYLIGASSAS